MGIDPQIGVKFCHYRKQKAAFLDHFVLEQPANQVRTFLLSLPSTRKRKKFQWKGKTCLFENATLPMWAPEVNLPVMFGVPETGLLKCTLRRPEQEGGKERKTARDIRRRADI